MIQLAAITHEGETFFARGERATGAPDSAMLRLVHGVHALRPRMARKILRNPVLIQGRPDELDYGALKIGAKRLREQPIEPLPDWIELSAPQALNIPRPETSNATSDSEWMQVADSLARAVPRDEARPLHEQSRAVGAVLVSRDGELLSWGSNSGASNRILHAELSTLLRLNSKIPPGATLYVTLKPCKLCAGAIWECAADRSSLRVVYRDPDPGPMGSRTVLDESTHERERASASDGSLKSLRVQSQLL